MQNEKIDDIIDGIEKMEWCTKEPADCWPRKICADCAKNWIIAKLEELKVGKMIYENKQLLEETKVQDMLVMKMQGHWHVLSLNGTVLPLEESLVHSKIENALAAVAKHLDKIND